MAAELSPEVKQAIVQAVQNEVKAELVHLRSEVNSLRSQLLDLKRSSTGNKGTLPKRSNFARDCCSFENFPAASPGWPPRDPEKQPLVHSGQAKPETLSLTHDHKGDPEAAWEKYMDIVYSSYKAVAFRADIWGACMLTIIEDFPLVQNFEFTSVFMWRLSLTIGALLVNTWLQIALIFWIANRVMIPNIQVIQNTYKLFHDMAWNSTQFDEAGFNSIQEKDRAVLCSFAISDATFLGGCLIVWVARCADEFRQIYQRVFPFFKLPPLPDGLAPRHMRYRVAKADQDEESVKDQFAGQEIIVVCMQTSTKLWLVCLVAIPRFFIASGLCVMGSLFLASSLAPADLILNSLAMGFVFDIDSLLFSALLPRAVEENVTSHYICPPLENNLQGKSAEEIKEARVKKTYSAAAFVGISVLGFVISMVCRNGWQPIIPGYEHDVQDKCLSWNDERQRIPCKFWDDDCFPK